MNTDASFASKTLVTRARRALEAAALVIAGVASMATSAPPAAVAPQPHAACANLKVLTCERSAASSLVVVEATGTDPISCDLAITQANEVDATGNTFRADMLPAPLRVATGERKTFSLSFLRSLTPDDESGRLALRLDVARTPANGTATEATTGFNGTCTPR